MLRRVLLFIFLLGLMYSCKNSEKQSTSTVNKEVFQISPRDTSYSRTTYTGDINNLPYLIGNNTYDHTPNNYEVVDTNGLSKQILRINCYVESDTAFAIYEGNIKDTFVRIFYQVLNDSTLFGYYGKRNVKISISGKKNRDGISFYGVKDGSQKISYVNLKLRHDTLVGNWIDLLNNKTYSVIFNSNDIYTGDINAYNYENKSIVFLQNKKFYKIPISKYLDRRRNYIYVPLLTELKKNHFYTLVRMSTYSLNKTEIGRWGERVMNSYLLYTKFSLDGEIVKNQVIKTNSDIERIQEYITYGTNWEVMRDYLKLDVFYLDKNFKYNIKIGRDKIENGIIINKEKTKINKYLYDTLTLKLEKEYNLLIKFKVQYYSGDEEFEYKIESVSELNKRDINKFGLFIEDLKCRYVGQFENNNLRWGNGDYIRFGDYDFDGFKDICIRDNLGSGMNNYVNRIWTFNQKNKRFENDEFLSSLSIYNLDEKDKSFHTYRRGNGYEYGSSIYKRLNGKIQIVENVESRMNNRKDKQIIITRRLVNGKWKETKEVNKIEN